MAFSICLDAGHGPRGNPYTNRSGYYEGTQMFKLMQYQKAALEQYDGVTVLVTRAKVTDDPSLDARGKAAAGCDLFYSSHSNAANSTGQYSSARGVSVIDSNKRPNKALADSVGNAIAAVMGNNFRGTTYRDYQSGDSFQTAQPNMLDYYGVIRSAVETDCKSAIIVEHGFHTNETDSAILIDDTRLKEIAETEVRAIAAHYGLRQKNVVIPEVPANPDAELYTVVKGDSLYAIGRKLGLPWAEIAALNAITEPYTIYAGQVLRLPRAAQGQETDYQALYEEEQRKLEQLRQELQSLLARYREVL